MVIQALDLLLHPGLLGFQPPSDLPSPFAFQLKINPRLDEYHAVSRLNHTLLAASHVLPIGATYPPSIEILKILVALGLVLLSLSPGSPGAGLGPRRGPLTESGLRFSSPHPRPGWGGAFRGTSPEPVQAIALYLL